MDEIKPAQPDIIGSHNGTLEAHYRKKQSHLQATQDLYKCMTDGKNNDLMFGWEDATSFLLGLIELTLLSKVVRIN